MFGWCFSILATFLNERFPQDSATVQSLCARVDQCQQLREAGESVPRKLRLPTAATAPALRRPIITPFCLRSQLPRRPTTPFARAPAPSKSRCFAAAPRGRAPPRTNQARRHSCTRLTGPCARATHQLATVGGQVRHQRESVPLAAASWVMCDDSVELERFVNENRRRIYTDIAGNYTFIAQSDWAVNYASEQYPTISFKKTMEV